jgi:subtilisin family serine protease
VEAKIITSMVYIFLLLILMAACGIKDSADDSDFNKQWALNNDGKSSEMVIDANACKSTEVKPYIDIGYKKMWEYLMKKQAQREVIVAIIDTGIDFSSRDLRGLAWENENEQPRNNIDDDKNGYVDDCNGWNFVDNSNAISNKANPNEDNHGTFSSGIIAAKKNGIGIEGVTRGENIKILSLKVLGENLTQGDGTLDDVISAIKYAEQEGASVCNLSLGIYNDNQRLYDTIKKSKMLFVTSAGNSVGLMRWNIDKKKQYPASYSLPNLISVANLSFDGKLYPESNFGPNTVDLAAPGTNIYSTQSSDTYGYATGTSFAAPYVTGVAALLYQYMKTPTPEVVKGMICDSVTKLSSLSGLVKTGGMLNAKKAVLLSVR